MLSSSERATLRRMPLFASITDDEFAELEPGIALRPHKKGETLFNWGEEATRFYGVLSGWVKVYRDGSNGDQAVLGIFGKGETFAEATVVLGYTYPASAEAVADCILFHFEREFFDRKLVENPVLNRLVLASITHHLNAMIHQVEQLKIQSAEERLTEFLLGLCGDETEACTIELPYDKSLIAGRLGMKPESLSRNLNRLSEHGVRVEGKKVTIENPTHLRERHRKFCHGPSGESDSIRTTARLPGN